MCGCSWATAAELISCNRDCITSKAESTYYWALCRKMGFPCGSAGKESACNVGDLGSIPELGRSPREGKGYPLHYSGLENSMDCIVHGVAKSQTWQSNFHFTLQKMLSGTSLVLQWLRICLPVWEGTGSIPGWGTKIPHARGYYTPVLQLGKHTHSNEDPAQTKMKKKMLADLWPESLRTLVALIPELRWEKYRWSGWYTLATPCPSFRHMIQTWYHISFQHPQLCRLPQLGQFWNKQFLKEEEKVFLCQAFVQLSSLENLRIRESLLLLVPS